MNSKDANKSFRLGVLGAVDGWYVRDLQRAAAESFSRAIEVLPIRFSDLASAYLGGSKTIVRSSEERDAKLSELDSVLVRTMPLGSLEQIIFRMNALHILHAQGERVINSPRCLEVCIDKWLTLDVAHRAGLEIPRTIACQTRDDAMKAWEELGGDCVVKPLFGGEGRGIMRVDDADLAWRVFSTLEQLQAIAYVQEFLPSIGYDLRLLVIGEDLLCVRRENSSDWRTNVSRGGRAAAHEPSFEQVSIAYRAAKAVGGWMVGVDLMQTQEGRNVLIEVNAVPGWRATGAALGVDVASLMLDRISQLVR